MPVVAVINRKGGSGKSTLATHLAGYCASRGWRVMLGDVDRQQSSLAWLRRRTAQAPAHSAAIVGWAVGTQSVVRPPAGITHIVLDTPGGLHGFELARVVMGADVILMPVCDSVFDRDSAIDCYAELMTLPRVASGRCQVALVGMRLDARTRGAGRLDAWAAQNGLPYIGSIREAQVYPRNAEQGLTLFDLPPAKVAADLAQWQPVVDWVGAAWLAAEQLEATSKASSAPISAPSLAKQAKRRALVRAPLAASKAPLADFRPVPREAVHPARAERFGWLLTVFRSRS
jgi:chromosome partitioning protein